MKLSTARLYGILDMGYVHKDEIPRTVRAMVEGQVDVVQLRAKECIPSEIVRIGNLIAPILRDQGIPFILNDHPALVADALADGAHVGQDDTPVSDARLLAGDGKIIGKSTHTLEQAEAAGKEMPDYIGFGPLFTTPTKPDYKPIGTQDIGAVHKTIKVPIFCIGGIKRENLREVLEAGARRIVIVSGILQAADISGYCRDVKQILSEYPIG